MRTLRTFLIASTLVAWAGCVKEPDPAEVSSEPPFALDVPVGFPQPVFPGDNPLKSSSVELGKLLFNEPRLSGDGTLSCAGCHFTSHAFSDTTALSHGVQGQLGFRNAPTLANVAYHPYFFRDGGVPNLELQVLAPIHDPHEMNGYIIDAAALLKEEEPYRSLAQQAYGRPMDAFVITRAIACYERTLLSGWSRFDRFIRQNDQTALTPEELDGWSIFSGAEANCIACHSGFDLSDHTFQNIGTSLDYATDPGRTRITTLESDRGKFKVPTLRNITLTAPYMHDGSIPTLEAVVDHFATGGLPHPNLSPLMHPFTLTPQQKADLLAFLNTLTDDRTLDQVP